MDIFLLYVLLLLSICFNVSTTTSEMVTKTMTTTDTATHNTAISITTITTAIDKATQDRKTNDMATRVAAISDMATSNAAINDMATNGTSTIDTAINDMATSDAAICDMATSNAALTDMATNDTSTIDAAVNDMATYDDSTNSTGMYDMATSATATRDSGPNDMVTIDTAFSDIATIGMANKDTTHLPGIVSFCPYSNFCRSKALKNVTSTKYESCCQICSCAPDCHLVGSCCPDAKYNKSQFLKYGCKDINQILNSPRKIPYDQRFETYHIIDDCPFSKTSKNFSSCYTPTVLQDFVVVSDSANEKVFRNRACALCHGITDIVEWSLIVQCSQILTKSFKLFQERDEFIVKNCYLHAIPPNKHIYEMSRCFKDVKFFVDTCIPSDQNDQYHKMLEKACSKRRQTMNTVYKGSVSLKIKTFANVYCYLCNNPGGSAESDMCLDNYKHIFKWTEGTKFTGILSMKKDVFQHDKSQCLPWEMWDNVIQACRTIHCSYGTLPANGKCEETFWSTSGLKLFALFEVVFRQGNKINFYRMLEILQSRIVKYFGKKFSCGFCYSKLFQHSDSLVIYFEMAMFTTEKCSFHDLIGKVRTLATKQLKRSIKFIFQMQSFIIDLKLIIEKVSAAKTLSKSQFVLGDCSTGLIQITDLQNCPRFQMTIDELKNIIKGNSSVHSSTDTAIVVNEDTNKVYVCTEYYFDIFANGKASRGVPWYNECWICNTALPFYVYLLMLYYM